MTKLSKAQWRMLESISDGEVQMNFDVHAGYWWTERGKRLPSYGKSDGFPPLPIRYLLQKNLVFKCATERLYSGAQRMKYELTAAGAAAIRSGKQ